MSKTPCTNGKNIPLERNKRICEFCNLNCVDDELHFLTECPFYSVERDMFFKEMCKLTKNFIFLS